MFVFAHNGHGALAQERDGDRLGVHAVACGPAAWEALDRPGSPNC